MKNEKKSKKSSSEELKDLIEAVSPDVKSLWRKGEKTTSICLEINIEKSQQALKNKNEKELKTMIDILKFY
jgi:hypothetical protein